MYPAHPFVARTFVIAEVNVVFPWSTCPIVPILTCGFVLSNFGFDMVYLLLVQLARAQATFLSSDKISSLTERGTGL
jgi:hypothetical protein